MNDEDRTHYKFFVDKRNFVQIHLFFFSAVCHSGLGTPEIAARNSSDLLFV